MQSFRNVFEGEILCSSGSVHMNCIAQNIKEKVMKKKNGTEQKHIWKIGERKKAATRKNIIYRWLMYVFTEKYFPKHMTQRLLLHNIYRYSYIVDEIFVLFALGFIHK